jgi:integrase/recombinase XerD
MEELTLDNFLFNSGLTPASVLSYRYQIGNYLAAYPGAVTFKYKDILNVMEEMASHKPNPAYRQAILAAIKKYYDFLIYSGVRDEHPCKKLNIRRNRNKSVIHQDLFTSLELELLMNREERYPELRWKNKAVISLLIYQGISSGEITRLKVQHIDLDAGKIFIKESPKNARRSLEMHPTQYCIFDRYINENRTKLLRIETDSLIIGKLGIPITTGEISYLVEQFKPLFPDRNLNPITIRQSVISNWINEKKHNIELVQLLAGHKTLSTTMLYRVACTEEKRKLINQFHPLG